LATGLRPLCPLLKFVVTDEPFVDYYYCWCD
jgi:hypothetical protein